MHEQYKMFAKQTFGDLEFQISFKFEETTLGVLEIMEIENKQIDLKLSLRYIESKKY
jgi:hypothetical protein